MSALGQYENGSLISKSIAAGLPELDGTVVSCVRGQEIVAEGQSTGNFYLVMDGLFHGVRTTPRGRRKLFAFFMTGDLCGLEPGASHDLAIEAVDIAAVAVLPRESCQRRMKESTETSAALFEAAARTLMLTVEHIRTIKSGSAEERLAWFLTMLATRSNGPDVRVVDLAMRRQDIADYLQLTTETISRTLTNLSEDGLIMLQNFHRVELLRLDVLARLAAIDREATSIIALKPSKPRTH